MIDVLTAEQTKQLLLYTAKAVIDAKPMLTEVDSAVGDGDHGIGMEVGMNAAIEKLNKAPAEDVYLLFRTMGKAMLMSMGGASGVIFGSMFLGGAKNQPATSSIQCKDFAEMFERALLEIQDRGKAQVGDKTMVDALSPAVAELKAHAADGFEAALCAAEAGAMQGVENTKHCEAKYGRSKTQATTIGFQDAGATSVWVIFRAMRDFVKSL